MAKRDATKYLSTENKYCNAKQKLIKLLWFHDIRKYEIWTQIHTNRTSPLKPGAYVTNAKRLLTKSFQQEAWLWLADAKASPNHSQAFC